MNRFLDNCKSLQKKRAKRAKKGQQMLILGYFFVSIFFILNKKNVKFKNKIENIFISMSRTSHHLTIFFLICCPFLSIFLNFEQKNLKLKNNFFENFKNLGQKWAKKWSKFNKFVVIIFLAQNYPKIWH